MHRGIPPQNPACFVPVLWNGSLVLQPALLRALFPFAPHAHAKTHTCKLGIECQELLYWTCSSKRIKTFKRKRKRFCSFPHSTPDFWGRQEIDNFDLYLCCCQFLWHISSCLLCLCFSDVLCNMSKQKANYAPAGRLGVLWVLAQCDVLWAGF